MVYLKLIFLASREISFKPKSVPVWFWWLENSDSIITCLFPIRAPFNFTSFHQLPAPPGQTMSCWGLRGSPSATSASAGKSHCSSPPVPCSEWNHGSTCMSLENQSWWTSFMLIACSSTQGLKEATAENERTSMSLHNPKIITPSGWPLLAKTHGPSCQKWTK